MTRDKIIDILRKVKALADRGVGAEAIRAKEKLKLLCEKYNITDEEFLEPEEKHNRFFSIKNDNERLLLLNIICMVLNVPAFKWGERNNIIRISLSEQNYNDINDMFIHFKRIYDEYSVYLMYAILSRNAISYIPKEQPNQPKEESESPESQSNTNEQSDKESQIDPLKLMKMAVAIEKTPWARPIYNNLINQTGSCTVEQNGTVSRNNSNNTGQIT